ncbi:MAG: hypothetical protein IJY20_04475 [Clostridia bacterium]|nr:hypothetical protein [Clostridia bacterium]
MKTRIFSLILACIMLLSVVPALFLVAGAEGEAEVAFTSSFYEEAQAGKITYDAEAQTVAYGGAWQAAILAPGNYAPIILDRMNPRMEGDDAEGYWAITPTANEGINANGWSQWWWGSLPGAGLMNLETYTIGFSNPQGISTYVYTVTEEGEFDISMEIDNFVAPVDENNQFFMSIMVNEKMVWPSYGGTYRYAITPDSSGNVAQTIFQGDGNWYKVTPETTIETLNEALSSLSARVKEGDRIEVCYRLAPYTTYVHAEATAMPKITGTVATGERAIQYLAICENGEVLSTSKIEGGAVVLPEYTGTQLFRGWDVNGDGVADIRAGATLDATTFDADIIYANAVTVGTTKWADHIPTLDANNMPIFTGNWQTGVFDTSTGTFALFGAEADAYRIITTSGSVWGGAGGGLYVDNGKIAFSGCTAEDSFMNEINYTAEYSGNVQFDLDKLVLRREGAKAEDYISFNFAVYVNDEKVWPADADMFNITSPNMYSDATCDYDGLADIKAGGFPLSMTLEKGDVVSLRTQLGNANNWMAYIHPTVTYQTLNETPLAVSADVTIGTDLGLNFYVEIVAPREGVQAGLEYWTNKPSSAQILRGGTPLEGIYDETTGFYKFTYGDLSAKEMTKLIYVRPYSYVGEEDIIYGDIVPFSIQMYADKAFGRSAKLDKVLATMLTYGGNAQSNFGYGMQNMANANVPADLRPGIFNGLLNDVYAQGEGENPITGASLLLDNQLGFKFTIGNIEGAEKYVLEFADNPEFTDAVTVDMVTTKEGLEQKASVFVNLSELDKTYYVRVVVDEVPGATLTYSMESYVARISNTDCSEGMYQVLISLVQFSRAIEEYLA